MNFTRKRKVVTVLAKKNENDKANENSNQTASAKENAENEKNIKAEEKDAKKEAKKQEKKDTKKKAEENDNKYELLEEKYLRLAAEYKNYQNRTSREKDEIYSKSVCDTVEKLLPVIDSVERASLSAKDAKSIEDVCAGIELINKMTAEIFAGIGVEAIDAVGKKFDANYHNAVMHIDDDTYGENEVVEEFQKGYKFKDKVIRYSMVKVAN